MTGAAPVSGSRQGRGDRLTKQFASKRFRHAYFARQLKVFLAAQIRALRGDRSQAEFGDLIGKPQSVVSRLERESYGKVNLQTLIDIAARLDIALVVRFVSFPTFLEWTKDYSATALAPTSYEPAEKAMGALDSALNGQGLNGNTSFELAKLDIQPAQEKPKIGEQLEEGPSNAFGGQRRRPLIEAIPCV